MMHQKQADAGHEIPEGNILLAHIDEIHTTELGELRIKKNLKLETGDVVGCCKKMIIAADRIERKGKNWYAYKGNSIITINAHSYTIITAHAINHCF